MSHVATVAVRFKDLTSLAKACERLGLELVQGQKTFKWYGRWVNDYSEADAAHLQGIDPKDYGKCEHAIRVKGNSQAYEIGLRSDGKGGYQAMWDFWAGGQGLMQHVSAENDTKRTSIGKLVQAYALEHSKSVARKQGFSVVEKRLENGDIKLELLR